MHDEAGIASVEGHSTEVAGGRGAPIERRQVVVGDSIAAVVAVDALARAGAEVVWYAGGQRVGGGFAAVHLGGRRLELGARVLELSYDAPTDVALSGSAAPACPPLSGYRPGPHGHREWIGLVDSYVRSLVGDELCAVAPPQMDLGGRMVDDWLLAGDLAGAVEAFAPSAQRFAAAAEAAVDRWGERGWFASEHHDLLQHHSLAEAGAAHLGSDASGRLIESFASRILRRGANDVIAALHRKIWLPLFWPSTAAAAFSGAPYVRPERPFATVRERGMSGLVDELVARVGAASTVEVRHVGNLVGLESDGPLTTCAFSDGTVVRSARPVLGVGARELFAAVGIELDLDPAHSSLGWVELPDGASAPDVWWVAAEDRPVFRASTSRPADSPPVVCCELAWWVDESELGTEAAAAIADAGIVSDVGDLQVLGSARSRSFPLPSVSNRARFQLARAAFDAASPICTVVGSASEFGADTFNEQVVQGLAAAAAVVGDAAAARAASSSVVAAS